MGYMRDFGLVGYTLVALAAGCGVGLAWLVGSELGRGDGAGAARFDVIGLLEKEIVGAVFDVVGLTESVGNKLGAD